jgi:hypothetical protein
MREVTAVEAERVAGFRVDRRRAYAVNEDGSPCDVSGALIFTTCQFTAPCSGCNCDCREGCGHGAGGCEECGYTGKHRQTHWVPYLKTDAPNQGVAP